MPESWTRDRFPQFENALRRLVEQHRELDDEPLHLALAYLPDNRDKQHIFLFEVIDSPHESINPDHDLFEVAFPPASTFPMPNNEELHLILTDRRELGIALEQNWPLATEVLSAIRDGNYQVLFKDQIGDTVLADLQTEAHRGETVRG